MPESIRQDRENMEYDVVIIGAGPSGLSCAIRLKQLAEEKDKRSTCAFLKKDQRLAHILCPAQSLNRALYKSLSQTGKKKARP